MTARLAVAAALALHAAAARAGGLEVGDNSAEAMGRGGAFVAKADNPTAIAHNPAGLAKLAGHHLTLAATAYNAAVEFQRAAGEGRPGYPLAQNTAPWFVAPMHLVVTSDLGSRRFTLGAGVYGPAIAVRAYGETADAGGGPVAAPQRFDMTSTGGLLLFPTLAAGVRVTDWLDLGVTFQSATARVATTSFATVGAACPGAPEDPACDVKIRVEAEDLFVPTGSAGLLLRPGRGVELGAMVRLPSSAELRGRAQVEFGPAVQRLGASMAEKLLEPESPRVALSNAYPLMARFGARRVWHRGDAERGDLELDVSWEGWSDASRHDIRLEARSLGKPLEPRVVDWRLKDTVAVRAGGQLRLGEAGRAALVLRAGGFYESAATEVSDTSLQVLGPRRIGLGGGARVEWGAVAIDLAYTHVFLPERRVANSRLTAMDFGGGAEPVVGNGTYRSRVDALYLQLTASYGATRRSSRRDDEPSPEPPRPPARRDPDEDEPAPREADLVQVAEAARRIEAGPDTLMAPRAAAPLAAERPVVRRARHARPADRARRPTDGRIELPRRGPAQCRARDRSGACRRWSVR